MTLGKVGAGVGTGLGEGVGTSDGTGVGNLVGVYVDGAGVGTSDGAGLGADVVGAGDCFRANATQHAAATAPFVNTHAQAEAQNHACGTRNGTAQLFR